MYLFVSKNNKSIYGYTKHKDIAIDFYNLNSHRFRLVELSKSEIKEGIILPAGGNITYYVLSDEDDIDTILISGMGSSTIIEILNHPYLKNIDKLIIELGGMYEDSRN